MSNWLIVESKNDRIFFQTLIEHLNIQNVRFNTPICQIDDFECMDGLNPKKLTNSLNRLKNELPKEENTSAIGIILDNDGRALQRIDWINQAVYSAFNHSANFSEEVNATTVEVEVSPNDIRNIRVSFCLLGVNNQGELETVLKEIKKQDSTFADCLDNWRSCLIEHGKIITDKDFDKFWLNNYIRYDTCTDEEQRQAMRKCSMHAFDYVMVHKSSIWDFDHDILSEVKDFLSTFVAG